MPKHLWAYTTAQLARYVMASSYDTKIYEKIGKLLKSNLIFSYFFPTLNPFKAEETVYAPLYHQRRGLCYRPNATNNNLLDKLMFEARFLDFYVSTAVDKNWAAEEGSLHEMEFIRPKINIDDNLKSVYYKGYFFIRPGSFNGQQHVSSNETVQYKITIDTSGADIRLIIEYNDEKIFEQYLTQLLLTPQVGKVNIVLDEEGFWNLE